MLLQTKLLPLARSLIRREVIKVTPVQAIRHGGGGRPFYRHIGATPEQRSIRVDFITWCVNFLMIGFYWYLGTSCYYSFNHHFVRRPFVKDPRLYTDAELGIPPDEEDGEAFPDQDLSVAPLWKRVVKPQ